MTVQIGSHTVNALANNPPPLPPEKEVTVHKYSAEETKLLQDQGVKLPENDRFAGNAAQQAQLTHLMQNLKDGNKLSTEDQQMLAALKAQYEPPPAPTEPTRTQGAPGSGFGEIARN